MITLFNCWCRHTRARRLVFCWYDTETSTDHLWMWYHCVYGTRLRSNLKELMTRPDHNKLQFGNDNRAVVTSFYGNWCVGSQNVRWNRWECFSIEAHDEVGFRKLLLTYFPKIYQFIGRSPQSQDGSDNPETFKTKNVCRKMPIKCVCIQMEYYHQLSIDSS